MAALIKIKKFILLTFLILFVYCKVDAQAKLCIEIKEDVCRKTFLAGDTIVFSFENKSKDTLHYHLAVMMYDGKEWMYSPYYTRYFNYSLSYLDMKKMFASKLPVTFSENYKEASKILLPYKEARMFFIVDKKERYKQLIKLRINIIGRDSFLFSNPFYFDKIKE